MFFLYYKFNRKIGFTENNVATDSGVIVKPWANVFLKGKSLSVLIYDRLLIRRLHFVAGNSYLVNFEHLNVVCLRAPSLAQTNKHLYF